MRAVITAAAFAMLGFALSGCAVAEVGSDVIGAGASVVGTAADVTGDVVSAPFGGDSDDSKKR